MNQFELVQVSIAIGNTPIVQDVSFALEQGQIGCLLGPSGSGKTTLLRAIAGFQNLSHGAITLRGETMSSTDIIVPAEKRRIGMMFQDLALFPHLSVADNIAFGINNLSRTEAKKRVDDLLSIVNMKNLRSKYPHELSGGQQQRVALCLLYTSPSPRDLSTSRMPSSA